MSNASNIKFGAFNPRKNLPITVSRKRGESNFIVSFQRSFMAERAGRGIGGRHFALSGYGIADFVWMDFGSEANQNLTPQSEPYLIAFEMKLKNWKRALSQAYRYSYFADQSVVVMPPNVAKSAVVDIDVFKLLDIGLWTFDAKTAEIRILHEPRKKGPRNFLAKTKAVALFERSNKFRMLLK